MNNALTALALGKFSAIKERVESDRQLEEITIEAEQRKKDGEEAEGKEVKESNVECNTTGKDTLIQSQSTGKKSRKSTKKTTTTRK